MKSDRPSDRPDSSVLEKLDQHLLDLLFSRANRSRTIGDVADQLEREFGTAAIEAQRTRVEERICPRRACRYQRGDAPNGDF